MCSIPCGHTKFSQPVRAAARFLGSRRHPPHTPHPTQPHQPSTAMRHSTPLRSPRGTFWSLGFAHPWGTSGRQRLRPRHGRRLLRRTGTASSTSAASWARCCCATTPAPRSWPRAGASAAGTRPAQRRYLLGGYYVDAHGRGLVVGFLMLLLVPARSYPESAGYVVAEIGRFLPLKCVLHHRLRICPALSVQWRSSYAKLKED